MTETAIAEWLDSPMSTEFPYDAVVGEYLRVGKHFVPDSLLKSLACVRDRLDATGARTAAQQQLSRFLNTALDKWDNRYDYPSYLGLTVLDIPTVDGRPEPPERALPRRDRLTLLLLADALGFELAALDGRTALLPQMRPDAGTVAKRCRLALRVARPALARLGLPGAQAAVAAAGRDSQHSETDPVAAARELCAAVDGLRTAADRRMLQASMLPVYVCHDEYLFIRVLQLFETSFAMLAAQLREAVRALNVADWSTAVSCLAVSELALRESAPLFSLLATMQVESFRTFRAYTEGASAIQSRNYKIVESLCRRPDAGRLDSAAYHSVPDVRDQVLAGQQTLDEAVCRARGDGMVPPAGMAALAKAMHGFSGALLRWRQTHYRLAVRMLGERSGTGYTEGTPYLSSVRTIPVFQSVDSTGAAGPAAEEDTDEPA